MLDQRLSSLFSFASHGSGRMLKETNGLYAKLVSLVPTWDSSYPALPSDLQSMSCRLKMRNLGENNCFLFCYVAAWHLAHVQSLCAIFSWQTRTNPETFSPSNPITHHPIGVFEMPMAFNQKPRFENLKKVQVNVFLYQKIDFTPLQLLKRRKLPFIWDIFLRAMVEPTFNFWSKTWIFCKASWNNNFYNPLKKYALTAFLFATQRDVKKDVLRLARKTTQALTNYQEKSKMTYNFKITNPFG